MKNLTNDSIEHIILQIKKTYPCFPKIKIIENKENKEKIKIDEVEKDLVIINKSNCCSEKELMRDLLHTYIIDFAFNNIEENNKKELLLKIYEDFDKKGLLNKFKKEYAFSQLKNNEIRCKIIKKKIAYLSEKQLFNKKNKTNNLKNKLKCQFIQLKENFSMTNINEKVFLLIDNINLKIEQENKRVNVKYHSFKI